MGAHENNARPESPFDVDLARLHLLRLLLRRAVQEEGDSGEGRERESGRRGDLPAAPGTFGREHGNGEDDGHERLAGDEAAAEQRPGIRPLFLARALLPQVADQGADDERGGKRDRQVDADRDRHHADAELPSSE